MRAVATRLGVTPMSLYRHIPDKQRLLQEMVETAAQEYEYDVLPDQWRPGLVALARQQRDLIARHPWLPSLSSRFHPLGPATLNYVEHCLTLFARAGVPEDSLLETVGLFNGLVSSLAMASATAAPAPDPAEQRRLTDLLATGHYPRFAALVVDPAPLDLDEHFDRLVERLLDGLA